MFTVKTKIKESAIHGIGVFADEFVPQGYVIWRYQQNFDTTINDEQFVELPKIAQEYLLHYGHYSKDEGGYVLCGDSGRFTNHSKTPNIQMLNVTETIAIKDIEIGEEITEDYYFFDESVNLKFS